jgi:methionine synthase II (cobalamin-independent)
VNGEDEQFAHGVNRTTPANACKTARFMWIASYCEFATDRRVTKGTPKVTMPAPQTLYFFASRETISRQAYADVEEFWVDLGKAYDAELRALADAGCTYVQMDEVLTSCLCDDKQRTQAEEPRRRS